MDTHRGGCHVKTGRDWSEASPSHEASKIPSNHQKLEEARKNSSIDPLEGAWPCQNFNFGFLAYKTVKDSFHFSHLVYGIFFFSSLRKLIHPIIQEVRKKRKHEPAGKQKKGKQGKNNKKTVQTQKR